MTDTNGVVLNDKLPRFGNEKELLKALGLAQCIGGIRAECKGVGTEYMTFYWNDEIICQFAETEDPEVILAVSPKTHLMAYLDHRLPMLSKAALEDSQ